MKRVLSLVLALMLMVACVGCGSNDKDGSASADSSNTTQSATNSTASDGGDEITELDVVYLMPATSSQYWYDYMCTGVMNAAMDIEAETGVKINVTTAGPAEEMETEAYVKAFENVIASKPDIILTATLVPDGTNLLVKEAHNQGIYVNFMSCGLEDPAYDEYFGSFFYCNNADIGGVAAQAFLDALDAKGIEHKGKVGVHTSVLVPSLMPRIDEFVAYLNEHAPELEFLEVLFNENVITKAQSNVEDQIAAYGDELVGFYGSDNITGDGIALAIQNSGLTGKVAGVVVDADDLEVEALRNGVLDAIVVQTPYMQSYEAMWDAFNYLTKGETQDKRVITPSFAVTTANMDQDDMKPLLDPKFYVREQ